MEFIDLKAQYRALKGDIDARMQRVLEHGNFILGPEVAELEARLAEFVGVAHCVTMASGTDALQVALMALGIGQGDEVITTSFSFIATAETIALLGAVPVFVDIEPDTLNIDPRAVAAAITPKTRAIMPVSLYGQCAALESINAMAAEHGIAVIEDGAQSFGATRHGRRSCALSRIGCTSFFPSKPLGCYGDGGACFTDDPALAQVLREIRSHGQSRRYHHPRLGVNSRLDTLQAAVLLAKLEAFPAEIRARRAVAESYDRALAGHAPHITLPRLLDENESVYAQYTVLVDQRDAVAARLAEAGVPTAVHYPLPLHLQPVFADVPGVTPPRLPHAEHAAKHVLSLPMHPHLDADQQATVIAALLEAVGVSPHADRRAARPAS